MPGAIFPTDGSVASKVQAHLPTGASPGDCEGRQLQDGQRRGTQTQPVLTRPSEGDAAPSANNMFAGWFRSPGALPVSGGAGMPVGSLGGGWLQRT